MHTGPDAYILDVALSFASGPSQHPHLIGVEFLDIYLSSLLAFRSVCYCWLDYNFINLHLSMNNCIYYIIYNVDQSLFTELQL